MSLRERIATAEGWIEAGLGRRRVLALSALAGFVGVFAIDMLAQDVTNPGAILYTIPVALIGMSLGTQAGMTAGVLGSLLYWAAALLHDDSLGAVHLSFRFASLIFLGGVVGLLATRLDTAEQDAARVLELAHEGIWTIDRDGRTTYANPRLAEILGTTEEHLTGAPALAWIVPGDPLADAVARGRVSTAGETEALLRHSDGGLITAAIAVSPLTDRAGRPRGVLALVSDVTERRRAEAELKRSEASLAEAQRIAHVGSWEWDVPRNQISWSDELLRIYGLDPDDFDPSYEAYLTRIHDSDRDRVDGIVREAFATKSGFAFRHLALRADGAVRVIDSRGDVEVEDGEVVRMAGIAHDVTEQIEAQAAFADARARLALAAELHDTVVQGLAVARYAGDENAPAAIAETLERAKALVADLRAGDPEPAAGSLRRTTPAG